jgi:hypothetical protein
LELVISFPFAALPKKHSADALGAISLRMKRTGSHVAEDRSGGRQADQGVAE